MASSLKMGQVSWQRESARVYSTALLFMGLSHSSERENTMDLVLPVMAVEGMLDVL